MAHVIWTDQALDDLTQIGDYIARDAPTRAYSFIDELVVASDQRLRLFPESGSRLPERPAIRQILHGNYRLLYHFNGEAVRILAVAHASRDLAKIIDRLNWPNTSDD